MRMRLAQADTQEDTQKSTAKQKSVGVPVRSSSPPNHGAAVGTAKGRATPSARGGPAGGDAMELSGRASDALAPVDGFAQPHAEHHGQYNEAEQRRRGWRGEEP